ncbi:MAG: CmcJ/NvfI family oxidoreductase [Aquabacterium sp.]
MTAAAAPVLTQLNYLAPQREPLHTYGFDPPDGAPRFNGQLQAHAVTIHDARALGARASLAGTGFTLAAQRSAVRDFWNEDELLRLAYPEAEALVRELSGAVGARCFDRTRRRRAAHRPPLDGMGGSFAAVREPVGRVHADYTPRSGPQRVRQVLGDAAAERVLRGRWAIYGLWRPLLDEPLRDAPLALADAASVPRADLVPNDLVYRERRGQTYAVLHRAEHRWYWFAQQCRDEVIVFVHYDSERGEAAITCASPHTAFEDPAAPVDAPPRQSLELRVLAWFDD